MPRILRNYLISFIIIGLFFLAVKLINAYVAERTAGQAAPPERAAPADSAPAAR